MLVRLHYVGELTMSLYGWFPLDRKELHGCNHSGVIRGENVRPSAYEDANEGDPHAVDGAGTDPVDENAEPRPIGW